jgi:hypothetical protein
MLTMERTSRLGSVLKVTGFVLVILFCFLFVAHLIGLSLASEYALYNQKEISKQEAVNLLPDSAFNEKLAVLFSDSTELLGNILVVKVGDSIKAISIKDVKFKGRGEAIPVKRESSYQENSNSSESNEYYKLKEAKEYEEDEDYFLAACCYRDAGMPEKAKELFIIDAQIRLDVGDLNGAAISFGKANEYEKATELYQQLLEQAKTEKKWWSVDMYKKCIEELERWQQYEKESQ